MGNNKDTKNTKDKNETSGCVGYFSKGIIKPGCIVLAKCDQDKLDELYKEYTNLYGNCLLFKYAICDNADKTYEALKNKIQTDVIAGNIYIGFSKTTDDLLKTMAKVKKLYMNPVKGLTKKLDDESEKDNKKSEVKKESSEKEKKSDNKEIKNKVDKTKKSAKSESELKSESETESKSESESSTSSESEKKSKSKKKSSDKKGGSTKKK